MAGRGQYEPLSPCEKLGHDYGPGPGKLAPLHEEGQVQVCSVCGLTRSIVRGCVRYMLARERELQDMRRRTG